MRSVQALRRRHGRRGALVLLAPLAFSACYGGAGSAAEGEAAVTPAVEAVQARSGTLPLEERLSGVVKAENHVTIRPEISAPIAEVFVRSGEAVKRGQPLVRLREDTLRDQLRQAEASVRLEQAAAKATRARVAELRAQLSRARQLDEQALVSRLEVETLEAQMAAAEATADQAEAQVSQARATVEERRSALAKTVVRAPVTGRVGQRNAEVGMTAETSTVLFEIGNLDRVVVEVPLTGEMLRHLREGQTALIHAPAVGDDPIRAAVSRISPFLAAGSFTTIGEIDVANPEGRLRPGMFVTVDVLYGESETATLVPVSAIYEDPRTGVRGVYVAAVGEAAGEGPDGLSATALPMALRAVDVVADGRATVGIRGVEPGEWVVTVGQHLLAAGKDATARVRRTTWERVLDLQTLQREDLLRGFLEKQQHLARTLGAEPPRTDQIRGPETPSPPAGRRPRSGT
ncbi:MAG TPA: efflux RND transporter periplasmic adaptor subunit [Vicinamibacteria bacterium]|nr:efflux RND transporter periplasmic adaptor subunit [Vicinamibacteria bacterium]